MGLIGQNQQTTFANPQNGQTPIDADVVRNNDNALTAKHNAHDADATIHVQTGTLAARPAAGTANAMYMDENRRLYADNGAVWTEVPYLKANDSVTGGITFSGTVTAGAYGGNFSAANLSGSTLAAGVTASSLTSVGTLTGLTMSGSGIANLQDGVLQRPRLQDYGEVRTTPTISGNTLTLDLQNGNVFGVALNANINTLTIQNPSASGTACSFTLAFTYNGLSYSVAWPVSVRWAGGVAPTLSSGNGKVDIFTFVTWDAGSNWFGFVAGQNF